MSTSLATAPAKPSALAVMASKIHVDPAKLHQTLKATVFKGASDEELLALVVVANTYGLNPLLKELYAFPAKGGGIVPVVSVDGWISMVNNHPQMDGMDFEDHRDDAGKLEAITCIIYRKDRNRPIKVTEYLSECRRNTDPWKMENRMLRHKALIQCARVAFGFSGVVDEDEGEDMRAATGRVVETAAPVANPFKKERQTLAAPAEQAEPEPEHALDRDAALAAISGDIKAKKLKNADALAIFKEAGILTAAKISDAPDSELAAMVENLGMLAKPEPVNEPAEETTASTVDAWLCRIEEDCIQQDITLSAFQDACRKVGTIGATALLEKQSATRLASIHANLLGIIAKANGEGEE